MDTPQTRLLRVHELVELILLNLSRFDIFAAQRICKDFNTTITGSPKLQRLLFGAIPPFVVAWSGSGYTKMQQECWCETHALRDFVQDHFELKPYSDADHHPDENGTLTVTFEVPLGESSGDGVIGWKGKSSVHPEGSWKRIAMGRALVEYRIEIFIDHDEPWVQRSIPASGTFGDCIGFLQEVREEVVQEQRRLELLEENDDASGSDWSDGS